MEMATGPFESASIIVASGAGRGSETADATVATTLFALVALQAFTLSFLPETYG